MTTYTVLPDSTIVYDDAYMNYTKGVKKYKSFWNSKIGRWSIFQSKRKETLEKAKDAFERAKNTYVIRQKFLEALECFKYMYLICNELKDFSEAFNCAYDAIQQAYLSKNDDLIIKWLETSYEIAEKSNNIKNMILSLDKAITYYISKYDTNKELELSIKLNTLLQIDGSYKTKIQTISLRIAELLASKDRFSESNIAYENLLRSI